MQTNDGIETPIRAVPKKDTMNIADLKDMNKQEEKKLYKYNNLYDKLRKKKDELQQLLSQRRFIIHSQEVVKSLQNKSEVQNISEAFKIFALD